MSDYKRFLSYIYAYDGDYKMNGCGFAKMEVRDSRYRLTVNLNCPLSGQGKGYRVGVYGGSEEHLEVVDIGSLEARNGGYVFGVTGAIQAFAEGRINIDGAGGLVVYREPGSRLYITSWSDPFVEIRVLRDCIYRVKNGFEPVKEVKEVKEIKEDTFVESNKKPEIIIEYKKYEEQEEVVAENIIAEKAEVINYANTEMVNEPEVSIIHNVNVSEAELENNIETEQTPENSENLRSADNVLSSDNDFIKSLAQLGRAVQSEEAAHTSNKESELKAAAEAFRSDMAVIDKEIKEITESKETKESQLKTAEVGELWHEFKRMYPKIRPFSEAGWEVLQIKAQDIGRLSRENWILGNNNFVLHGYYKYGYLILARKHKPDMDVYVLGVPGTFSINEKFMASMFGMSEFMEADSKRPDLPKNFGYWCTHISM